MPTRAPLDPVEIVERLGRARRLGRRLPRRRSRALRRLARRARPDRRALRRGRGREPGMVRPDGHHQPVRPPGLQGRRLHLQRPRRAPLRPAQDDARDRPRRRARRRRRLRLLGRPRGRRGRRVARTRATPSSATARRSTSCASYVVDQGYELRFALEPKPNEPRGDIFLPTVGHALAFIDDARASRDGRRQPRGRARDDVRPVLLPRRGPGAVGRQALPHRPQRPERIGRYDQDLRFGSEDLKEAFFLVRLLETLRLRGPAPLRRPRLPQRGRRRRVGLRRAAACART